jgi:hypothetical protein
MNLSECGPDEYRENLVYFERYRQSESEFEFEEWDDLE